jgi:predicted GTPase
MGQTELLKDQNSRAIELRERLCDRELIISVIGKFKAGKSSLINGLLEEELLPVGIIPLTTVVTEIRKAKSFRAVVCFANGYEQEIRRSDLFDSNITLAWIHQVWVPSILSTKTYKIRKYRILDTAN